MNPPKSALTSLLLFLGALVAGFGAGHWYTVASITTTNNGLSKLTLESTINQLNTKLDKTRTAIDHLLTSRYAFNQASTVKDNHDTLPKMIRKALRDELKQINLSGQDNFQYGDQAANDEDQILDSEENLQAFSSATEIVTASLEMGSWSKQDALDFGKEFALLDGDQRMELLLKLIPAIENKEIVMEYVGPPYF